MSSEPTYWLLTMALPAADNMPAVSLQAQFDENVVFAGEFVFGDVDGNSNAVAFANLFSYSTPPGASGAALAYIPGSTMSLSGQLVTNGNLPVDINLFVTDPVTGNQTTAATLPANTSDSVEISWTAPSSGDIQPRTCAEISRHVRERHGRAR